MQDTTIPYFDFSQIVSYMYHNKISDNFLIFPATDTIGNNLILGGKNHQK
jgi:hypothetical protein